MKEVLWILPLYLWQFVYVAQDLWIPEAFAHLADVAMKLADLLSAFVRDVE